jgi:hypothetical protein
MNLTLPRMVIAIVLASLWLSTFCWAQESYPFFRGVRQEGMGGAGIATVDDETALFINPAGLGKIRGPYFSVLNAQIESNVTTQSQLSQNSQYLDFVSNPQDFLNLAKKSPDVHLHGEAQTLPSFVTTNFGIGLYGKYQADGQLMSASNLMQMNYLNDVGAVIGYCFRLFSGRLKIGLSGKIIDRTYVNGTFAGSSTSLAFSNMGREGVGAGWDGSVMLSAPWAWLPSITGVVHDVGGTNFTLSKGMFNNGAATPPPQAQVIDLGIGLFPILDKHTRASITAEYDDVLNVVTSDVQEGLHVGGEINFSDIFFLRAGMNEMYWTAGLEFAFGHSQLQLASYGENIGTIPYQTEDRRYVIQYGFRF